MQSDCFQFNFFAELSSSTVLANQSLKYKWLKRGMKNRGQNEPILSHMFGHWFVFKALNGLNEH